MISGNTMRVKYTQSNLVHVLPATCLEIPPAHQPALINFFCSVNDLDNMVTGTKLLAGMDCVVNVSTNLKQSTSMPNPV